MQENKQTLEEDKVELEAEQKKLLEEQNAEMEAEAKAEAEKQEALIQEQQTLPGVKAGSAPTSLVGVDVPVAKEIEDTYTDHSAPDPEKSIYKISTLSGKECIPCAFVYMGQVLTLEEARQLYPDLVPADFTLSEGDNK